MTDDKKALEELFGRPVALRAEAKDALEAQLVERLPRASRRGSPALRRGLAFAAVLLILGGATQVPAAYEVDVGRRMTLQLADGTELPEGEGLSQTLRALAAQVSQVDVRLKRRPGEKEALTLELWGRRFVSNDEIARRLSAKLHPEDLQVEVLQGRFQGRLLEKAEHALFGKAATDAELVQAREALRVEIQRREGPDAQVDVSVEKVLNGRAVKVKVIRASGEH